MKRLGVFKRKGALIAVGLSVVLLGIGAVFAFNSDRSIFSNLFQLPTYTAEYKEEFVSPNDWKTCDETPKTVVTTNKSNGKIKVRLSYEEYWRNKENTANLPLEKDGETLAIINFQNESDWTKRGNWYYYNHELEPNEATNSLLKSVTLNCDASLGGVNVCEETSNGIVCSKQSDPYEEAKYHLNVTVQTTSGEFPLEDEFFAVSINPNGGTFNGSTEIYTDTLQYGTVIDLTNLAYADHELVNWTKNGSDTYTGPSITVRDDLTLVANWQSSLFHTITVNPNGGTFGEHTEAYSESIRQSTTFTLPDTEPTREDYLFDGWTINGEPLTSNTFTVTEDATILANWSLIIAQNGRTSKFYRSLAEAESEAQSGDTISLVRDAEEQFTNTKNITLDLNAHILTGSLTNAASGDITILNGEINNPDGTAVTNNGTLTMGINDYIDENTVNIEGSTVRLVGSDTGLKQNGEFKFYDGFIEGEVGLEGGYNDSPFYRKAMDDEIVYYFPFVDKSPDDDTKQRVILESSDLAVSKTKVGGDIYYYSLQDNINTSIRTGYKIYIAREDWPTGEPITVPENKEVTIDLEGHTFTATDTITVNGKLTIEDSHSAINSETGEVEYAGNILTPQTAINNGELVMKNSRITGTTVNDTIQNNATLTMRGGRLGATSGYVIQPIGTETYDLDDKSYLYSTSANRAAVYVTTPEFTWNSGNIYSFSTAIYANGTVSMSVTGGTITGTSYGFQGSGNKTTLNITGGKISGNTAIQGVGTITINTGDNATPTIEAVYAGLDGCGTLTLNSGLIIATTYGVRTTSLTMNGGIISVNGPNGTGVLNSSGAPINLNGGEIIVTSNSTATTCNSGTNRNIYGIYKNYHGGINIKNATITVTGSNATTCDHAYGIYFYTDNAGGTVSIMEGANVHVSGAGGNNYGLYTNEMYTGKSTLSVTGGKIYSENYGVYLNNSVLTVGNNKDAVNINTPEIIGGDYALYGNNVSYYKYYDGILRGGVKAYKDGAISAIPDGTTYHIESSTSYRENCWLTDAAEYLMVNGVRYNSLQKAYDAITGDSGTIKVIDDVTIEAVLPNSPTGKNLIFDLNGHQLTITQPLINSENMTITDSDPNKAGQLNNYTANSATIINNGSLDIESGHIYGAYRAIQANGPSLTISDGAIESGNTAIYANGTVSMSVTGGTITGTSYGFQGSGNKTTLNITGGKISGNTAIQGVGTITINTGDNATPTIEAVYAGLDGCGTLTLNSGLIIATTYGVRTTSLTMNGGIISVNGPNGTGVLNSSGAPINLNGGEIIVTSNSTATTCNSGTNRNIYGIYKNYHGGINIKNATITVTGSNATTCDHAYGIYFYTDNAGGTVSIMEGANVHVSGAGGNNYGLYTNEMYTGKSTLSVTGGKIYSENYGVYLNNSVLTVGNNKDAVNINTPEIIGGDYALYGNNVSYYKYYDGILRGGVKAYKDSIVKAIADHTDIHLENQTISGTNYDTRWLVPEDNVAQIVGGARYKKLSDAITAAQTNETIKLLADNYVFSPLNIPSEKELTINMNGFDIILGSPLTNDGNTRITNEASNASKIDYRGTDYIITNNTGSAINISKLSIDCYNGIKNDGVASISDSSINATNIAIRNTGNMAASNNMIIQGGSDPIYADGGELSVSDASISGDYIYVNSGTLSLSNSSATKTGEGIVEYVTNKGTLNINKTSLTLTNTGRETSSSSTVARAIYNTGTTSIINNSVITHTETDPDRSACRPYATLYNDGGSVSVSDSEIILDTTNMKAYTSNSAYAVYNPTGSFAIESGTITSRVYGPGYGIYNGSGTVIIGVPEPTNSPNYGGANADVSQNNPNITAISTNNVPNASASVKIGMGVKNASGGRVEYYDGKVSGNTSAFAEEPTATEHFYEVCTELDTSTTPNLYTAKLFWMRDGQSTCGQN